MPIFAQALAGIYPVWATIVGWYAGGTILFAEHKLFLRITKGLRLSMFFIVWVVMSLSSVLDGQLLFGGGDFWAFTLSRGAWVEILMFFVFWALFSAGRAYFVRQALLNISDDMKAYSHRWQELIEDPMAVSVLEEIDLHCRAHGGPVEMKPAMVAHTVMLPSLRRSIMKSIFTNKPLRMHLSSETADVHLTPVACLDQLYLQVCPSPPLPPCHFTLSHSLALVRVPSLLPYLPTSPCLCRPLSPSLRPTHQLTSHATAPLPSAKESSHSHLSSPTPTAHPRPLSL